MTVAELNFQRKQAGLPLIRFHIRRLQPDDIQDLRDGYAALYEISDLAIGDGRGYTAIARGHGYDVRESLEAGELIELTVESVAGEFISDSDLELLEVVVG